MFVREKYKCFSEDCNQFFIIGYNDEEGLDDIEYCPFCGSDYIIPQVDDE